MSKIEMPRETGITQGHNGLNRRKFTTYCVIAAIGVAGFYMVGYFLTVACHYVGALVGCR